MNKQWKLLNTGGIKHSAEMIPRICIRSMNEFHPLLSQKEMTGTGFGKVFLLLIFYLFIFLIVNVYIKIDSIVFFFLLG